MIRSTNVFYFIMLLLITAQGSAAAPVVLLLNGREAQDLIAGLQQRYNIWNGDRLIVRCEAVEKEALSMALCNGNVHGVFRAYGWQKWELENFAKTFGGAEKLGTYPIGHTVVGVIASKESPLEKLTLNELALIYSGYLRVWEKVPSAQQSGDIVTFLPNAGGMASLQFRLQAMEGRMFSSRIRDFSQRPTLQILDPIELVAAVAATPGAIGFLQLSPEWQLPATVKYLAISRNSRDGATLPTNENVWTHRYPLVDDFTLYLRPDAPPEAVAFAKLANGKDGVSLVEKHGLWPAYKRPQDLPAFEITPALPPNPSPPDPESPALIASQEMPPPKVVFPPQRRIEESRFPLPDEPPAEPRTEHISSTWLIVFAICALGVFWWWFRQRTSPRVTK